MSGFLKRIDTILETFSLGLVAVGFVILALAARLLAEIENAVSDLR